MNKASHSKPTIYLHWFIALSFIAVLLFGLYIADMPRSKEKFELLSLHKSFGVGILFIAVLRIVWRVKEGSIDSSSGSAIQDKLAKGAHHLLLLATLLLPISGVIGSVAGGRSVDFFAFQIISAGEKNDVIKQIAGMTHEYAGKIILALILVHILAAIKHQFVNKDNTLGRMLGKPS